MHLIAITGLMHQPKAMLTQALVVGLAKVIDQLFLIDNSDSAVMLDNIAQRRLTGGCVCCSLAATLIPLVKRLETDYAILPVSAAADPESLAFTLDSLRGTRVHITTIALIDDRTHVQHSYLAQKQVFHSDIALYEPFDY